MKLTGGACNCKIQVATAHVKLQVEVDKSNCYSPADPLWNKGGTQILSNRHIMSTVIAIGFLSTRNTIIMCDKM